MIRPVDASPNQAPMDDEVGRLFDFAGRRPKAPADVLAETQATARLVWQEKVLTLARARRRRRLRRLAAAAVVLAGTGLYLWHRLSLPAGGRESVATVEASLGGGLAVGTVLEAGGEVATGAHGRLALRLASGASVRLDVDTRLGLESATALALHRGTVYLDSGDAAPGSSPEVRTPFGVARDVGTQFTVDLRDGVLRVRVREGEVELDVGGTAHRAPAGTALTVRDGAVESQAVPGYGQPWSWVLRAAPPFDADGRSLREVLDWVARETGWRLSFADPGVEREAAEITVRGSLHGVPPDQALALVFPGTGLTYRVESGGLVVDRDRR